MSFMVCEKSGLDGGQVADRDRVGPQRHCALPKAERHGLGGDAMRGLHVVEGVRAVAGEHNGLGRAGRRMADTAANLVDCVLPEVPIRQWVLTLPYPLRYRCTCDAALTSDILRAFLRALFSALRRRARSQWDTPRGQCGSVTFIQRFGSALNLNLHFHTLVLDGVYTCDKGNAMRFLPLSPPSPGEVARTGGSQARLLSQQIGCPPLAPSPNDLALVKVKSVFEFDPKRGVIPSPGG